MQEHSLEINGRSHPAPAKFPSPNSSEDWSGFVTSQDRPFLDTRSPRMKAFLTAARRAALISATILLIGETGAGKSMMARQIHLWSRRRDQPFVVVDCAALSESLFENKSFDQIVGDVWEGAKEGARHEPWETGTVFLDNLADLNIRCQGHVLAFIEARELAAEADRAGVRIISALNRDVAHEAPGQHLRDDLFFRFSVISLHVPAIRDRREDLLPLADHLLEIEANRKHRRGLRLSEGAARAIQRCDWPGNIRELHNAIERAVVIGDDELVTEKDLVVTKSSDDLKRAAAEAATTLRDLERNHIARVLATGATVEEAAAILGIDSSTLWRKRKRYNLD
jgi:two-component system, NtrC family, response regulator AlgB